MPLATPIFSHFETVQDHTIDTLEITDSAHSLFLSAAHSAITHLRGFDEQAAQEIASEIYLLLAESLTAPIPFDASQVERFARASGPSLLTGVRWGQEVREKLDNVAEALCSLCNRPSAMREQASQLIEDTIASDKRLKIFCRSREREFFEGLCVGLTDDNFLHSASQYARSEEFDVLLRIGPMRRQGWASTPDAIINAPKYALLQRLIWSGTSDESGFGLDPIIGQLLAFDVAAARSLEKWTKRSRVVVTNSSMPPKLLTHDFFAPELAVRRTSQAVRAAHLIQLSSSSAILLRANHHVLSVDLAASPGKSASLRSVSDDLAAGMLFVASEVEDVDLGQTDFSRSQFSKQWKKSLASEMRSDPDRLIMRLKNAGLKLVHLRGALENWSKPAARVIHAPQSHENFHILLRLLNLSEDPVQIGTRTFPYWRVAWEEIRRSRGTAIQAGFHENELIDEQLIAILEIMHLELEETFGTADSCSVAIPEGYGLTGRMKLDRIVSLEAGYMAPDSEIDVIQTVRSADKWRS